MSTPRTALSPILFLGVILWGGCRAEVRDAELDTDPVRAPTDVASPAPPPEPDLRIEVDIAARELYVFRAGVVVETHPVAVGTEEWPTRTGEWTIDEVVLNPRWVPPDEAWAEEEDEVEPGDPDNPMGAAQLVYDRPRSIHGTNEPGSIGRAVSHGSIRVHDDVALELARQVMEAAGVDDIDRRMRRAEEQPDSSHTIRLPRGIPVTVRDGG
jgi:lipoprotein-anchoring transpeptidase ErfK/SrfK